MKLETPDVFFEVEVEYLTELQEYPQRWVVRVKMAGVELFSRTYANDREIRDNWVRQQAQHAQGVAYRPERRPRGYAGDVEDARELGIVEFAEHLAEVLHRVDPMSLY